MPRDTAFFLAIGEKSGLGAPRMQCSYPLDPGDPTVAVITYLWRDAEEEARPG